MKRIAYLLVIFVLLFVPNFSGQAQGGVTAVDSLVIDFWPDYDRTAVLVLMTGTLPTGTATPATVTLPLPDNAEVNAVAYMDATNGLMNAEHEQNGNQLVLTTPNLDFRVEYYIPYEANGSQRSFTFSWTSSMSVNQLEAKVQQPRAASGMVIEPTPIEQTTASDGFTYYLLPNQIIPAGQPFTVNVNYTMSSDALSVNSGSGTIDLQPSSPVSTSSNATKGINWPVVAGAAGGILVIAALAFLYLGNQSKPRVRKPNPTRPAKPNQQKSAGSRFCHNCGDRVEAGDRFCRNCGTPVKGK
ncbi:MAG: zinc-ribbon domain-containing protein [Ardenticatenaceae bacterium]|nr:zinc-ribbon domain-containing protein [Ardenticatenaceae bacterium]MCB9443225.1 zinc-ribbon domain-containing protein [Ardenticatenaceae bacterium]